MLRSSVFNARSTVRPTLSLPHPPIPQFPPPLPSPDYNTHCIDSSNQKESRRKREGRGRGGGGRRDKVAEIVNSNASNVILPQIPPHWNVPSSLPPSLPSSPPLSSPPTLSPSLPLFPTLLLSSPPSIPPIPHHTIHILILNHCHQPKALSRIFFNLPLIFQTLFFAKPNASTDSPPSL